MPPRTYRWRVRWTWYGPCPAVRCGAAAGAPCVDTRQPADAFRSQRKTPHRGRYLVQI